jgi:hypothetical protein
MLKNSLIALLFLAMGVAVGFQMPRGASLIATLTGSGDINPQYAALGSAQALMDFEDMIASGREMVLKEAQTEQEAIEGMRWLLRVAAMSTVVAADANPIYPHFQRMDTDVRKVGGDNPDAEYAHVTIDGQYDYIITGNLGDISYLGFTFNAGVGMTPRRNIGYMSDNMLTVDDNGDFTLILAKQKPSIAGDWFQITDDASGILVRQYFTDREKAVLPTLNIEILGDKPSYTPPTDEQVAGAITGTTFAFLKLSTLHQYILPELMEEPNGFIKATSEKFGDDIAGTDNLYMLGSYQLADDEALVIEVTPPDTRYWNITMETRWHETLDYLHRSTSLTKDNVSYSADGTIQFIVAHKNPGVPNWLDTSSHNFGFITFRWLDGKYEDVPMPTTRIVKFADL